MNCIIHKCGTLGIILAIFAPTSILYSASHDTGSSLNPGRCLAFYNDTTHTLTLRLTIYKPPSLTATTDVYSATDQQAATETRFLTIPPHQTVSINVEPKVPEEANNPQVSPYLVSIAIQTEQGFTELQTHDIQKLNLYFGSKLSDTAGCKENKQRQDVAIAVMAIPDVQLELILEARGIEDISLLASFGNGYHLLIPDPTGFIRPEKKKLPKSSIVPLAQPTEMDATIPPTTTDKSLFITTPVQSSATKSSQSARERTSSKPNNKPQQVAKPTTKPKSKPSTKPKQAITTKPKLEIRKDTAPQSKPKGVSIRIRPKYRATKQTSSPGIFTQVQPPPRPAPSGSSPAIIMPTKPTIVAPATSTPAIPPAAPPQYTDANKEKTPTFEQQLQQKKEKLRALPRPEKPSVVDLDMIAPTTPATDITLHPTTPAPISPSPDTISVDLHPAPLPAPGYATTPKESPSFEQQLKEAKKKLKHILAPDKGPSVNLHPTTPSKDTVSIDLRPSAPTASSQDTTSVDLYPAIPPASSKKRVSVDLHPSLPTTPSPDTTSVDLHPSDLTTPLKDEVSVDLHPSPPTIPSSDTVSVDLRSSGSTAPSKDKISVDLHSTDTDADNVIIDLHSATPQTLSSDEVSIELY